jgi:hypothetical protein
MCDGNIHGSLAKGDWITREGRKPTKWDNCVNRSFHTYGQNDRHWAGKNGSQSPLRYIEANTVINIDNASIKK